MSKFTNNSAVHVPALVGGDVVMVAPGQTVEMDSRPEDRKAEAAPQEQQDTAPVIPDIVVAPKLSQVSGVLPDVPTETTPEVQQPEEELVTFEQTPPPQVEATATPEQQAVAAENHKKAVNKNFKKENRQ